MAHKSLLRSFNGKQGNKLAKLQRVLQPVVVVPFVALVWLLSMGRVLAQTDSTLVIPIIDAPKFVPPPAVNILTETRWTAVLDEDAQIEFATIRATRNPALPPDVANTAQLETLPDHVVFCSLHNNEQTGVRQALNFLAAYGGVFIILKNDNTRNISLRHDKHKYTFDPNRMFTPEGLGKSVAAFSKKRSENVEAFVLRMSARFIDSLLPPTFPHRAVVAVHNNTDGDYCILQYLPEAKYAAETADIYVDTDQDPDDFFIVTQRTTFEMLKAACFNVMLQRVPASDNDGSLSYFSTLRQIEYINIEAEHQHDEQQFRMLEAVRRIYLH